MDVNPAKDRRANIRVVYGPLSSKSKSPAEIETGFVRGIGVRAHFYTPAFSLFSGEPLPKRDSVPSIAPGRARIIADSFLDYLELPPNPRRPRPRQQLGERNARGASASAPKFGRDIWLGKNQL
jgi:hypothetical protein